MRQNDTPKTSASWVSTQTAQRLVAYFQELEDLAQAYGPHNPATFMPLSRDDSFQHAPALAARSTQT